MCWAGPEPWGDVRRRCWGAGAMGNAVSAAPAGCPSPGSLAACSSSLPFLPCLSLLLAPVEGSLQEAVLTGPELLSFKSRTLSTQVRVIHKASPQTIILSPSQSRILFQLPGVLLKVYDFFFFFFFSVPFF